MFYPTAAFRDFRTKLRVDGWYERDPVEEARILIVILVMFMW